MKEAPQTHLNIRSACAIFDSTKHDEFSLPHYNVIYLCKEHRVHVVRSSDENVKALITIENDICRSVKVLILFAQLYNITHKILKTKIALLIITNLSCV